MHDIIFNRRQFKAKHLECNQFKGEMVMEPRILIADDAAFMRRMLRNILQEGGFEVIGEADTGVKAVEFYKELKPDVVTMDITMPEMDGLNALKEIITFDPDAKVLMCSAMNQHTIVVEAIKLGAVDFIEKPFETDQVVKAINKVLHL